MKLPTPALRDELLASQRSPASAGRREVLVYLLLFLGSLFSLYPFLLSVADFTDEGVILQGATRIVSGQVVYRDFFEFITPGSFYLTAGLFKLFGTTFLVSRLFNWVVAACATLLVYAIARLLNTSRWAVASALLFLTIAFPTQFMVSHHWFSITAGLLALWFLCLSLSISDRRALFLLMGAGASSAISFLFLQNTGVYVLLASFSYLLFDVIFFSTRKRYQALCAFSLGGVFIGLSTLPLVFAIGWQRLVDDVFLFVIHGHPGFQRVPYPFLGFQFSDVGIINALLSLGSSLSIYGPLIIYPILAVGLPSFLKANWLTRNTTSSLMFLEKNEQAVKLRAILAIFLNGLCTFLTAFPRSDITHLAYSSAPLCILFVFLVQQFQGHFAGSKRALFLKRIINDFLLIVVMFNVFGHFPARQWQALLTGTNYHYRIAGVRGPIYLYQEIEANDAARVVDFISSYRRPGETLYVYPTFPIFNFLTATKNPTFYDLLTPGDNTSEQFLKAIAQVEQDKTLYIVYNPSYSNIWRKAYPNAPPGIFENTIMDRYIRSHYFPIHNIGSFVIMQRNT